MEKTKPSFRAVTFNMQHGQQWDADDPDGAPVDLAKTIAAIRAVTPDVIFLQEVEKVDPARGPLDPPPNYTHLRAALPEFQSVFAYPPPDPAELPFGYGLAIFAREPLETPRTHILPAPEDLTFEFQGRTTRPTARVMLETAMPWDGRRITLLNVHLQAFFMIGTSSDIHRGQRDAVAARLAAGDGPTILAGDLNSAPSEGTVAQFEAQGFRAVPNAIPTWKRMPYVLDHVLHSPALAVGDCHVVPTNAADHEMLVADFRFA